MTRQSELFRQICDSNLTEIPNQTFIEYSGYKRGLKSFIKKIEHEEKGLPTDFVEGGTTLWNTQTEYQTSGLEMLMYVVGCMGTQQSFEALTRFATKTYHPFVRCEACYGLTFVHGHDEEIRTLALRNLASKDHLLDIYSGILLLEYQVGERDIPEILEALTPLLSHDNSSIRMYSVRAISKYQKGRSYLRDFRETLLSEPSTESDRCMAKQIDEVLKKKL